MFLQTVASLLAPQQNACHLCGALLGRGEATLCDDCRRELSRCRVSPEEATYADCSPLTAPLAAFWYEGAARELVLQLKFGHDRFAALPLADGLCAAYLDRPEGTPRPDVTIPIPAHLSRLRARGYNQAEELARAFCAQTNLPFAPDGLRRLHHNTSQISRGRKERLSAMAGAFQASRSFAGMRVLLVDDVFTTGATAISCGETLLLAGASQVDLLVCCMA